MNNISLPQFTVEKVIGGLSETVDWGLTQANIPETWKVSRGEGVTIFILDTAAYTSHIDLVDNFVGGRNFSISPTPDDKNGHASACAGIIAASENSVGVIGVAPKAKFFLVKVLNDNGTSSEFSVVDGLRYCYLCATTPTAKHKPDIVSMSLGTHRDTPIIRSWIQKLYEINIPVVCAAGNSGKEGVAYPAKYPEVIAVAAYGQNGEIAKFSSFGDEIDFTAPGVDIYTTNKSDGYILVSGTSFAAPYISGVIALLLSKHRKEEALTGKNDCKTVEEIRSHLERYAKDRGVVGKDKNWGYGIIDVEGLMGHDTNPAISILSSNTKPSWIKRLMTMVKQTVGTWNK